MVPVQSTDILVLDTSALIDGKISPLIEEGRLSCSAVVVPVAAVDELQAQASKGREPGFLGLEELKRLRRACEARSLAFKFEG
jgi:ATPase